MTLTDYLIFLQSAITLIPFTILDLVFFISLGIYVASEKDREILKSVIILASVTISWLASLFIYSPLSFMLQSNGLFAKGTADGISVLIILGFCGAILGIIYRLFILNAEQDLLEKKVPIINIIFGGITFAIIASATATILLSFPLIPFIKQSLNESMTLSYLVSMSQKIEGTQQKILGNDTSSTLNFITTKPVTDHSLVIPSVMRFSANSTLQPQIIQLVNDARVGSGSNSVQESEFGSQVAQALALRMAATNQLSRTEIDGNTPFDLLDRGNISYTKVSFLSTHAQSMEIAIQGLMEIPQYNTQITSSQYTSIGAGVVSLNEHGYIVTLLFIQ